MSIGGSFLRATSGSFAIGDRIRVGDTRGVVIDHSLLVTTLLEIGPSLRERVGGGDPDGAQACPETEGFERRSGDGHALIVARGSPRQATPGRGSKRLAGTSPASASNSTARFSSASRTTGVPASWPTR